MKSPGRDGTTYRSVLRVPVFRDEEGPSYVLPIGSFREDRGVPVHEGYMNIEVLQGAHECPKIIEVKETTAISSTSTTNQTPTTAQRIS